MGFFDLFNEEDNRKKVREVDRVTDTEFAREEAHMDLREEELDIDKYRVETGDVVLHKDIIEEEKVVNVPVSHDQVVIEKKTFDRTPTDEPINGEETIHIPVTAERVDVDKHTVVTGEISAHKRSVQETEQVRDILHKEVADVETEGNADVLNKD
ncbi:YsnF/AvaK domain-containing protein [Anaerobacillus alkaliphilus]|uniref:YsnF/AvaK domain-containing protein n=1 Tax=Anaerobacillus alkaliphilus TaxID=1548597 RepID=A0A4Q0VVS9_9BACI|nr:YsnF/AvaK domain-containing protein [Anaerobacillus alkaliphilus]RXJ03075.1 YsnF/AvaK domain-containing protein [Anaerobacillus alkaliphilus]